MKLPRAGESEHTAGIGLKGSINAHSWSIGSNGVAGVECTTWGNSIGLPARNGCSWLPAIRSAAAPPAIIGCVGARALICVSRAAAMSAPETPDASWDHQVLL